MLQKAVLCISIFFVIFQLSFPLRAQSVHQEGQASLWEDKDHASQYAALHAEAPLGTLIEVKNLRNDRIVVVEVVAKPETDNSNRTILFLSQKAFDQLQSPNTQFQVSLTYNPEAPKNSFVIDPIRWKQESEAQKNPFENAYQPNFVNSQDPFNNLNTTNNTQNPNAPIYHTVNNAEKTIYDIARLYNIYDASKIAQWNNLGNRVALTPGQRLVIYSSAPPQRPIINNTYPTKATMVQESGFVELIRDIQDPKPFVALHRSAPVGTLMTIGNPANNRSAIVTVVGPLKNASSGTIIQITEATYNRLGGTQTKFPVQLSYPSKSQTSNTSETTELSNISYAGGVKTQMAYLNSDILVDKWWIAFHKTAPSGSYVQVRNPKNNQSVTFLVAGPLQGEVTDPQITMQTGQAGIQALNGGETTEKIPVTAELVKGVVEGNMERIVRDIANVYEEGMGGIMESRGNKNVKSSQNQPVRVTSQYSTPITHLVKEGETIYTLSSKYNIARSELRFWNNLTDERLEVNQKLTIYLPKKIIHQVKPGETKESIADLYKVNPKQIEIWNNLAGQNGEQGIGTGQNLILYLATGPRPNGLPNAPQTGLSNSAMSFNNPVLNTQNNARYTCLHKTAPIGTLILVERPLSIYPRNRNDDPFGNNSNYNPFDNLNRNNSITYSNPIVTNNAITNPQNAFSNQSILVEVVGKLADTDENRDILIKLSEEAFKALSKENEPPALKIAYFEQ